MNTKHIVIFDGTSHFVESAINYELGEDEYIVGRFNDFDMANKFCDEMNEECIDKRSM